MKRNALATEDLDVEPPAVPHAHGQDKQEEHPAPERAVVEQVNRGRFC
jgi:hypothetical protein